MRTTRSQEAEVLRDLLGDSRKRGSLDRLRGWEPTARVSASRRHSREVGGGWSFLARFAVEAWRIPNTMIPHSYCSYRIIYLQHTSTWSLVVMQAHILAEFVTLAHEIRPWSLLGPRSHELMVLTWTPSNVGTWFRKARLCIRIAITLWNQRFLNQVPAWH